MEGQLYQKLTFCFDVFQQLYIVFQLILIKLH